MAELNLLGNIPGSHIAVANGSWSPSRNRKTENPPRRFYRRAPVRRQFDFALTKFAFRFKASVTDQGCYERSI
jgi:hypothetical protein